MHAAPATRGTHSPQGVCVNIIIITNGDKGCSAAFCHNYTSDQIAVTRRAEALAAAAALGVKPMNVRCWCRQPPPRSPPRRSQVHMLGYEDGGLAAADYNEVPSNHPSLVFFFFNSSRQVLHDVVQQLRLAQADVVVSFYPYVCPQTRTAPPILPSYAILI